jgi:hypothetical protein
LRLASAQFGEEGRGGDATGGTATLEAIGNIDFGYGTFLDVSAFAGGGTTGGGNALGGTVNILSGPGGNFSGDGFTSVSADAAGGNAFSGGDGGTAQGGTINIEADRSTMSFGGGVFLRAEAQGGFGQNGGNAQGAPSPSHRRAQRWTSAGRSSRMRMPMPADRPRMAAAPEATAPAPVALPR